jgi:hypothetical protein
MATEIARDSVEDYSPAGPTRRAPDPAQYQSLRQERAPTEALSIEPVVGGRASPGAQPRKMPRSRTRVAEHAVFLVPGLLGFESFATFSYFADRVVAALRARLERSVGRPVPVLPLPIAPTASLKERQCILVRSLADRLHALEHGGVPLRVHLIGHSTGGLDANLLTQDKPLVGEVWSDIDPRAPEVRTRIGSVISIASPHQGACITRDPLARWFSRRDPRGLAALLGLSLKLLAAEVGDAEFSDLLSALGRDPHDVRPYLSAVLARWKLLDDLDPSACQPPARRADGVLRRSFVTIAGRPIPGADAGSPADALFRDIARRASGWSTGCAESGDKVQASVARLERALGSKSVDDLVIRAPGVEVPSKLDAGHNDGVVNSARQLMDPDDPDELAGIVIGDHFDVVGYYDRYRWVVDGEGRAQPETVVSGLLHSGSAFRDDQFFELYGRVASVIAEVVAH